MAFLCVESLSQKKSSRVLQNAVRALEVVLLSAGLVSTAVLVKGTVMPYSCEIVLSTLLGFWNFIKCLLSSPLYMCIIINSMVVLIAVSSTLQHENDENQDFDFIKGADSPLLSPPPPPLPRSANATKITQPPPRRHIPAAQLEPTPSRTKTDKKNDEATIEATWAGIIGGAKQNPKEKQLKKCETWQVCAPLQRTAAMQAVDLEQRKELRKSETFNDAVSVRHRGGLIRRDPSVGLDELNEQVEAFIKKFNENMRLQRQESDQRFLEMVNRGI